MNRWLDAVAALAVTQGEQPLELVKGHFSIKLIGMLETIEVTTQASWANLKTKILEWCGNAKADDKAAAEARWEDLKMEDFSSVADFDLRFYAAAKKCKASDERHFSQYRKAISASLKKSMYDTWLHPAEPC